MTRGDQTLRAAYDRQVQERGFRKDPAQIAAVEALEDVRSRLIAAARAKASTSTAKKISKRALSKLGIAAPEHAERGLYLWGGVGRGKTWLMDLFFQSLPFKQKIRRHFHRFMYDVHGQLRALGERQSPLEEVAAAIAADTRVICFDEFFVTDIADAMILGGLFESLFRRGVTLVATSNVPPKDLYKDGLQRARFLPAIKLLEQNTKVLNVDGGVDYRLRQLTQAGTYLLTNGADTTKKLEALFHELSDGDISKDPVEIEGRKIPVVAESDNVVWFEFEAICEGPRSQNDYIHLARDNQSVIVSNVPKLTSQRENAARRFIALVDELYDHGVNLVVSAAEPPNEIYQGEKLTFEFQRTVSRLIEMQTEEYLAREHRV